MLKITADPNYRTVGINETVTYRVESTDTQFQLDEEDVFLWGAGEVTDMRDIGNGRAIGGTVDGPVRGGREQQYSFAREGKYQILVTYLPRQFEVRPGWSQYMDRCMEYYQNVAPTESFMWDPVNNERTHSQDPGAAAKGLMRYYNMLNAAGIGLFTDLSSPGIALKDRHAKQLKTYADFAQNLFDRLASTADWIRIPLSVTLTLDGSRDQVELNVFLAHPKNDGIVKHWKIVDWTHPGDLVLDREYDGKGLTDAAAIKAVTDEWALENQYPPGQLTYRVPRGVYGDSGAHGQFTTEGRSWTGQIADFLERVGLFLTVVAFILAVAPIPGSTAAAVALVGIFAGAVTATGAVLNMVDRHEHGVENASADAMDMLTIAGALMGVAASWARGATLAIKFASGIRSVILVGEITLDSVQGILVASESIEEIEGTINDKTLTPDEKFKRILKTGAALAIRAALIYVNIKGTLKDLQRINTPKPPAPKPPETPGGKKPPETPSGKKPPESSNGKKLDGSPEENLKELKDPKSKVDLTEDPTITGNTKDGPHTTTVHADPPRTGTTRASMEGHFPENKKFWIDRFFSDTEIRLKHRFHEAPDNRSADLKFNAHISSEGKIHVDVIKTANWKVKKSGELITSASEGSFQQAQGLAEPVYSEYFEFGQSLDGFPALKADELYPLMFDHFEAAAARGGTQIKGIDGQFAWSNYRAWKAAVDKGMDPATAILDGSATGKYWKKELLARGYEFKMVPGFPQDMPDIESVFWEFTISKKK